MRSEAPLEGSGRLHENEVEDFTIYKMEEDNFHLINNTDQFILFLPMKYFSFVSETKLGLGIEG